MVSKVHIPPTRTVGLSWKDIPSIDGSGACGNDVHVFAAADERIVTHTVCACGERIMTAVPSDDGGWDVSTEATGG